jgi:hypothetical protein
LLLVLRLGWIEAPEEEVKLMRSRSKVLAALAVMALLTTGCFRLGGFRLTKQVVENGEKTVLELSIYTTEGPDDMRHYPFIAMWILAGGEGQTNKTVDPRVFDVEGKFGPPRDLIVDNVLRDALLAGPDETCGFFLREDLSGEFKLVVLRTEKRVDSSAAGPNAEALTKIGLLQKSDEPTSGGSRPFQAIVGGWDDDVNGPGAGVVDTGEETFCSSDTWSWFTVKPDPGATPMSDSIDSLEEVEDEIGR